MNLNSVVLNLIIALLLIIPFAVMIGLCGMSCFNTVLEINTIHTAIETIHAFERMCTSEPNFEKLKKTFTQMLYEYPCINKNDVVYGLEIELSNSCMKYLVGVTQ